MAMRLPVTLLVALFLISPATIAKSSPSTVPTKSDVSTEKKYCLSETEKLLLQECTMKNSNRSEVKDKYIQYRDVISKVHSLEQALILEYGSLISVQPPSAKELLSTRTETERTDSIEYQYRTLAIPGPAFKARRGLMQLVGARNMTKIDAFLKVSSETARFIETGSRTVILGF